MDSSRETVPQVGKPLLYTSSNFHPLDLPAQEKLTSITPHSSETALWSFELWTVGLEAAVMDWFMANWTLSILFSVLYMALIALGLRIMRDRARFEMRLGLILWSGTLAVYSIVSAVRASRHLYNSLTIYGFYHSVCNPNCFYGTAGFWALTFVLSKVVELGDTVFIILRKQPLIFLHWYHHVTVLVYSWVTYAYHAAPGRWFTIMNMNVHAVMYTYYTARACRIRVPRSIMMSVTVLQLSQMVVGIGVTLYAYLMRKQGTFCHFPTENLYWAFAMYLSYFLLFINYFYRTYIRAKTRPSQANGVSADKKAVHNGSTNGVVNGTANGHLKAQ